MNPLVKHVVARYRAFLAGTYYRPNPGTPIKELLRRWVEDGDKVWDDAMPMYFSPRELWPHREYTWKRNNARDGYAKIKGKSVWLSGPLKWDALMEDMKLRGWDPNAPLKLVLGKDGNSKAGEGNHRLAIAREVGISKIPVDVLFGTRVRKSPQFGEPVEVTPKAVQKVVEDAPKRKQTPEEVEQIDELMDLLF